MSGLNFNDLFTKAEHVDEHGMEGVENTVPVNENRNGDESPIQGNAPVPQPISVRLAAGLADEKAAEQALKPMDLDGQWAITLNPLPINLLEDQRLCSWCPEGGRVAAAGLTKGSGAAVCERCAVACLGGTPAEGGRVVGVAVEEPAKPGPSSEQLYAELVQNRLEYKRADREAERLVNREEGIGAGGFTVEDLGSVFDLADVEKLRNDNDYLVKALVYKPGITFIHAAPNVGKTLLAIDLVMSVATGQERFLGKRIAERPRVLYFFAEGASRLWKRRDAWCQVHGVNAAELSGKVSIVPKPVDLVSDPAQVQKLINFIKREKYGLVVIDPWLTSIPGADVSQQKDMTTALNNLLRLKSETDAAIVVVHHDNRTGAFLGSVAIDALCDSRLHLSEDGRDDRNQTRVKIDVEKSRDDAKGTLRGFLEVVQLGYDADGDQVSSVAFAYDETQASPSSVTGFKAVITDVWRAIQAEHNADVDDMETPPPSVTDFTKNSRLAGSNAQHKAAIEWLVEHGVVEAYTRRKLTANGRPRPYEALRPMPIPGGSTSLFEMPEFVDLSDSQ